MISGFDRFHEDPSIDFVKAKKDGLEFVISKASEGTTFEDPSFVEATKQAKAAGLLTGGYGFARPGQGTPEEEAALLIKQIKAAGGVDFPPVLDLEDDGGGMSDEALQEFCTKWREAIQKEDPRKPILYVDVDFYERVKPITGDFLIWLAEYGVTTPKVSPFQFWQFSDKEKIQGGTFDGDYFNGTLDELKAIAGIKKASVKPSPTFKRKSFYIQKGDTLSKLALDHRVPQHALQIVNGIKDPNEIEAGKELELPVSYIVRPGDTLSQIAASHGVTVAEIANVNRIPDVDQIPVGLKLWF